MHYFAGIDIGTTHTKIVLFDVFLQSVFSAKKGYSKGFGAKLDAPEILNAVKELLKEADEFLPVANCELTVCFSAAMHSLVLVDESGLPLTDLLTWADLSALPLAGEWAADDVVKSLFQLTGTPIHPMSPFCKLAWLKHSNPTLLNGAFKCIGIKEFVWFHITGKWETDYSIASATGLFSSQHLSWVPAAIGLAGARLDQLPEPVSIFHTVRMPAGRNWVIGASDGCLAQLGSAVLNKGEAALTIGTSGAIRITLPDLWIDGNNALFTYYLDGEHFICGGATNNGGIVLQWWEQGIMSADNNPEQVTAAFGKAVQGVGAGCDGLVCLPYFGGERAPVWDAGATGIFAGIKSSHQQAHFKRAIIEGICFNFRLLLEKLESVNGHIDAIHASGGFTGSDWWVQIMADILQKPIKVSEEGADASALGAVAVGMKAMGIIADWKTFHAMTDGRFIQYNPNAEPKVQYDKNYKRFQQLIKLDH